jgi:hypothetical protein
MGTEDAVSIFDRIKARIRELTAAPQTIAERAAPRIEAMLISDATTKRGNVPSFAPGAKGHPTGDVAIRVTAEGDEIRVNAPDWVMRKAREYGQPSEWGAIVREESARGLKVRK